MNAMSRPRAPLLLLLAATAVSAEPQVVETAHYRLELEGKKDRAEEYGRVLEAAWPQFKEFLGRKPRVKRGHRLRVRWFGAREAMVAAIREDGGSPPDASGGGLYWPPTKTAYAYRQGTEQKTRHVLLHEAAHQFHFLACTKNENPAVAWWTEGVAEHLAHHHWDGKNLELGVVPLVSLEDEPKRALKEATKPDFDLDAVVSSKEMSSYAMAWALVRFAATGRRGKPVGRFSGFARKLDAGNESSRLFRRLVGKPERLLPDFRDWLHDHQQPWRYVHNEWQSAGPSALRGTAKKVWSVCARKDRSNSLKATMRVAGQPKGWRGGVVLHFEDGENFSVAALDWGGFVHVQRMEHGRWKIMERGRVPGIDPSKDAVFHAFRRPNGVSMMIGNTGFGPWQLPKGPFGLVVYRSDLLFTDLATD